MALNWSFVVSTGILAMILNISKFRSSSRGEAVMRDVVGKRDEICEAEVLGGEAPGVLHEGNTRNPRGPDCSSSAVRWRRRFHRRDLECESRSGRCVLAVSQAADGTQPNDANHRTHTEKYPARARHREDRNSRQRTPAAVSLYFDESGPKFPAPKSSTLSR